MPVKFGSEADAGRTSDRASGQPVATSGTRPSDAPADSRVMDRPSRSHPERTRRRDRRHLKAPRAPGQPPIRARAEAGEEAVLAAGGAREQAGRTTNAEVRSPLESALPSDDQQQ